MNDYHNAVDLIAGTGLFLFTGAEVAVSESTIFEILSKFGVIAVLWFWLKDLKKQMKDQLNIFDKETNELKTQYEKILLDKNEEFKDYKERMEKLLNQKVEENKYLQDRLLDKK